MNKFEEQVEQIRYLIETEPDRVWKVAEIGNILGYRGKRVKQLQSILNGMVEDGHLTMVRSGAYTLGNGGDNITGVIELVRSGAGFVTDSESGESIRVPQEEIGTALPGDIVVVRRTSHKGESPEGRIVKIQKRGERIVVGTFTSAGRTSFVIPIDPVYSRDIAVEDAKGAKEDDRVVVRILDWDNPHANPHGEIIDVIGPADKPSLDTEVVMRQYELPGAFPQEAIEEASRVSTRLGENENRLDIRDRFILTVDPATAKDFDDALSLEADDQGNRVLGVHIADVSHYVRPGSALDREAAERGTSVYLVDKVIPMLPEQLSNGVCSLRPGEDRLCFSVFLTYDAAGHVIGRRFARSIIRSKLRLSYEQALAIIEKRKPEGMETVPLEAKALLCGCASLALQLRDARMKAGALDLDVPEVEIKLDADGRMTGIETRVYDISHQMIEECMVAANEAVAAELLQHKTPIMSRLHEAPDPDKLEDLAVNLRILGFRPGNLSEPRNLARFLASIADHPLREHAHTMILRSMKRAVYSADGTGHFGLAKQYYSHFTSPIRRYPDLVLHRQLARYLDHKERTPKDYLKKMALQCTEREQRADEAERTLVEIKKYRYIQQQLDENAPEEYDGVIAGVTNFGLFIDIPDLQIGGLVHISAISDEFVRYERGTESLLADGRRYAVGGNVRVYPVRVDFPQRQIDFGLVRELSTQGKPTRKNAGKGKPRKGAHERKGRSYTRPSELFGRDKAPAEGRQGKKRSGFPPKTGRKHFDSHKPSRRVFSGKRGSRHH